MWSLLGALVLALPAALAFWLVRRVPDWLVAARRPGPRRLLAAVELLLSVALLAALVRTLAGPGWEGPIGLIVALGALGLVGVAIGKDYVAGLALRAEGRLERGDVVKVGPWSGTVDYLGTLRVTLRTGEGVVLVPNQQLLGTAVGRIAGHTHGVRHTFEVEWPEGVDLAEAQQRIRQVVLLHPGAAASVGPEFEPLSPTRMRVTVVSLERALAFELERRVRRLLDEARG